jgi:hypothetical protein
MAHAVIPHHHHSAQPEIMCLAHDHDATESHPSDPSSENTGLSDCLLSRAYARIDGETLLVLPINEPSALPFCGLFLCAECSLAVRSDRLGLPLRLNPFIPFLPTDYVAQSFGLRAPPFC